MASSSDDNLDDSRKDDASPHDKAPTRKVSVCVRPRLIPLRYLVADRSEAGRGPVADLLARASSLLEPR